MLHRRKPGQWGLIAALALQPVVFNGAQAAHPLETEDTGTQGAGNVEFENGLSWIHDQDTGTFTYQPQFSYGVTPAIDLIVQPSWLATRDDEGLDVRGLGDTNLDAKWRFFGSAPWSFGVRAGLQIPTSEHALGLPSGKVSAHELVVATYDAVPFTVHTNLGLTQNPDGSGQRSEIAHVSGALLWAVDERLVLTMDGGAGSDPAPHRHDWPASLLAGVIYTIQPGLDADLGYHEGIGDAHPLREVLAGITYRFAL